jgi:hypothetical protein
VLKIGNEKIWNNFDLWRTNLDNDSVKNKYENESRKGNLNK